MNMSIDDEHVKAIMSTCCRMSMNAGPAEDKKHSESLPCLFMVRDKKEWESHT
jgi:hypothetical protein